MLVVIVIVLRFDVAVLEAFVFVDDSTHARRFLGLGGSLSVTLSPSRDERDGTVGAGGGEAEGEESSDRRE